MKALSEIIHFCFPEATITISFEFENEEDFNQGLYSPHIRVDGCNWDEDMRAESKFYESVEDDEDAKASLRQWFVQFNYAEQSAVARGEES